MAFSLCCDALGCKIHISKELAYTSVHAGARGVVLCRVSHAKTRRSCFGFCCRRRGAVCHALRGETRTRCWWCCSHRQAYQASRSSGRGSPCGCAVKGDGEVAGVVETNRTRTVHTAGLLLCGSSPKCESLGDVSPVYALWYQGSSKVARILHMNLSFCRSTGSVAYVCMPRHRKSRNRPK